MGFEECELTMSSREDRHSRYYSSQPLAGKYTFTTVRVIPDNSISTANTLSLVVVTGETQRELFHWKATPPHPLVRLDSAVRRESEVAKDEKPGKTVLSWSSSKGQSQCSWSRIMSEFLFWRNCKYGIAVENPRQFQVVILISLERELRTVGAAVRSLH